MKINKSNFINQKDVIRHFTCVNLEKHYSKSPAELKRAKKMENEQIFSCIQY